MSNKIIDRKSEETGISKDKLKKIWEQAQAMTAEKNLKGDSFFKMLNSIFEKLVKNEVKKESLEVNIDDVICEFVETIYEETMSGDIAQTDSRLGEPNSMFMRKPCFHCDDKTFHKIGFQNRRKRGWYNKFYGTNVGEFARRNKRQDFYIKNTENEMYMLVKRK